MPRMDRLCTASPLRCPTPRLPISRTRLRTRMERQLQPSSIPGMERPARSAEASRCSIARESRHDSSTPAGIGRHRSASLWTTIWTLGWQGVKASRKNDDYFVLRNYSQDGQELGAFLPRSSFEPEPDPVGPM